jgi:hypothetical protein
VEAIPGHSADGDGSADGYSLDEFYDRWKQGEGQAHREVVKALRGLFVSRADKLAAELPRDSWLSSRYLTGLHRLREWTHYRCGYRGRFPVVVIGVG